MQRILITGGSGFIGAWVAKRLLARGFAVRIFDQRAAPELVNTLCGVSLAATIEWLEGDVSDAQQVAAAAEDCDLIIHLAAILTPACQSDPLRGAHINLLGTLNVFTSAIALGHERVLYMSSAGVFGPHDGVQPEPTTHYGAFKLAGEGSARAYWHDHGLPSIGFRPLVVYGPGRTVGLTADPTLACRAAALGEPYTIGFSGESNFVYVDDLAAAFEAALIGEPNAAEVFNVVGELASVKRLCQVIEDTANVRGIDSGGPSVPVSAHIAENGLYDRFPDLPRTSLVDGVAATIEFYRSS
jgi:UDP-glucose 4-epimerase